MKRIIYSIYIDIPKDLLDEQPPYKGETEDKNQKAKREFAENRDWLLQKQKDYAESIGVEYRHYSYDQKYIDLQKWYNDNFPYITEYNIINFYKIHLMYELAKEYDEILYLDLDVVPITKKNFFNVWDLSQGIAIRKNQAYSSTELGHIQKEQKHFKKRGERVHSIRSPKAKWWNSLALCSEYDTPTRNPGVYNTGIVGATKEMLKQLDYFGDFEEILETMTYLKEDEFSMWPEFAQAMFGWDNETIWGFKTIINQVPTIELSDFWHLHYDESSPISKFTCLIHVINKEFTEIRNYCEENNL